MAETFLTYRQHIWLKAAIVAALVCIAGYLLSSAQTPAYGGTLLGLSYGILGFLAILVLLSYGMRKRSYWSTPGTLQAWLSNHIYLGLFVLLLVLLHSGFQFGLNIHSFALLLLVLVIGSGVVGAYAYLTLPQRFSGLGPEVVAHGKESIQQELQQVTRDMLSQCAGKSPTLVRICEREIQHGLPGPFAGWRILLQQPLSPSATLTLQEFQTYLEQIPAAEQTTLQRLAALAARKREIEYRLVSQMRLQNLLEAWLYIHVPMSIMMLVAVLIHIATVLYY